MSIEHTVRAGTHVRTDRALHTMSAAKHERADVIVSAEIEERAVMNESTEMVYGWTRVQPPTTIPQASCPAGVAGLGTEGKRVLGSRTSRRRTMCRGLLHRSRVEDRDGRGSSHAVQADGASQARRRPGVHRAGPRRGSQVHSSIRKQEAPDGIRYVRVHGQAEQHPDRV